MKAFFIIFLYFLFDRETYYILHSDTLSLIYVSLSKFFAVFVILMALIKQFNKNTLKVMGCICLVFFSMLISTVIKDGDVRRAIMIMYPVLAMGGLMLWQCSTFNRTKLFVRYIAVFLISWLVPFNCVLASMIIVCVRISWGVSPIAFLMDVEK